MTLRATAITTRQVHNMATKTRKRIGLIITNSQNMYMWHFTVLQYLTPFQHTCFISSTLQSQKCGRNDINHINLRRLMGYVLHGNMYTVLMLCSLFVCCSHVHSPHVMFINRMLFTCTQSSCYDHYPYVVLMYRVLMLCSLSVCCSYVHIPHAMFIIRILFICTGRFLHILLRKHILIHGFSPFIIVAV